MSYAPVNMNSATILDLSVLVMANQSLNLIPAVGLRDVVAKNSKVNPARYETQ